MKRELTGLWGKIYFWACLVFAGFHLYTAGVAALFDIQQRAVHITFGVGLALFVYAFRKADAAKTKVPIYDLILLAIVIVANANAFILQEQIYRDPTAATLKDIILGALLTLVIIDVMRRIVGWAIPIMMLLAFAYIFISPYLPGFWKFRGLTLYDVLNHVYYSLDGIYGTITGISATLVAVFIIFGSLLLHTGAGETFIMIAKRVTGRYRGGPAKVAVVASGLFGTVSGSAVANVAVTGNYTIPLMKSLGYRPAFAGAVEAAASTGGMIMPPIMGIGAFIMSELIGVSYLRIMFYAIIPAILYYTCVFAGCHFEALRLGLAPMKAEDLPAWREVLTWKRLAPFVIPIVLMVGLLLRGLDITTAGFTASVSVMLIFFFEDFKLSGFKTRFLQLGVALSKGGGALLEIVAMLVGVGILISILGLSGIIIKFSGAIMQAGETSLIAAILLAALIPLILGMAIFPVAAYILAVAIVAPPLMNLGLDIIPVNMFIFYVSCLAPITPPVCAAVFVGAAIAKAKWVEVAWVAVRLAAIAFIIPFFFVLEPTLLAIGPPRDIIINFLTAFIGTLLLAAGFFGYLLKKSSIPSRLLYVAAGFLLLWPGLYAIPFGLAAAALGIVVDYLIARSKAAVNPETPV